MTATDFRHRFAANRHLPADRFEIALLFECSPIHVLIVRLFVDDTRLSCLTLDRELVAQVASARSVDDVLDAIARFRARPENRTWIRRTCRFRLSTRRLRRIAERHLRPDSTS